MSLARKNSVRHRSMEFLPRYADGAYRNCRWCRGHGCLACGAEADKEYKRQFPNGAEPILTIANDDFDRFAVSEATGGPSIEDAHGTLGRLAEQIYTAVRESKEAKP